MSPNVRRARVPLLLPLVALSLGAGVSTSGQEVWQADVRVQALDVTPVRAMAPVSSAAPAMRAAPARGSPALTVAPAGVTVRAQITSDNDDDARAVRLEILLPVGSGVLRLPAGCQAATVVQSLTGRVTCDLGDIPVRGLREVVLTASAPPPGARFAVFVTSDTPDPNPSNNFAERVSP
jgi:hypothetical protein